MIEKTSSWKYHGSDFFKNLSQSKQPILICVWHGFFIFPLNFLKNNYIETKIISSTHPDSMILAKVLNDYGFSLIKGSSTRGAKNVLKEMMLSLKNSSIIAITNDGPKGPARVAKGGAIAIAQKFNARIVFITGKSNNYIKLKTWDSFIIPKLFSKNDIYINEIICPTNKTNEELGVYISNKMNKIQNEIGLIKNND